MTSSERLMYVQFTSCVFGVYDRSIFMFVNDICASNVVESFNAHISFEKLVLKIEKWGSHTDFLDLNLDISIEKLFKKTLSLVWQFSVLYCMYATFIEQHSVLHILRNNHDSHSTTNSLVDCTENQERLDTKDRWLKDEIKENFSNKLCAIFKWHSHILKGETKIKVYETRLNKLTWSGVPRRPELVGSVKPFVYRQWKLRHVTVVKSVNTTASIRTTHCRSFHKM